MNGWYCPFIFCPFIIGNERLSKFDSPSTLSFGQKVRNDFYFSARSLLHPLCRRLGSTWRGRESPPVRNSDLFKHGELNAFIHFRIGCLWFKLFPEATNIAPPHGEPRRVGSKIGYNLMSFAVEDLPAAERLARNQLRSCFLAWC